VGRSRLTVRSSAGVQQHLPLPTGLLRQGQAGRSRRHHPTIVERADRGANHRAQAGKTPDQSREGRPLEARRIGAAKSAGLREHPNLHADLTMLFASRSRAPGGQIPCRVGPPLHRCGLDGVREAAREWEVPFTPLMRHITALLLAGFMHFEAGRSCCTKLNNGCSILDAHGVTSRFKRFYPARPVGLSALIPEALFKPE
jgi:hypothetical protein